MVVIAGDDRDRTTPRQVLSVIIAESRVVVEGVNMITKHMKPNAQNPQGGIVKVEAPIAISNVMLWDAKSKDGSRVSRTRTETGFSRISKKSGEVIK